MEFQNKHILVLGAGVSGIAVAEILHELGAVVTLNDAKPAQAIGRDLSCLEKVGILLVLGSQDDSVLNGIDYLVISPGISIDIPLVEAAKSQGIVVMSEIEVAYHLCPAPILAITGTNGKTTTTTLVGQMLKAAGKHTVVGGNIGAALSKEVRQSRADGVVVAEVSSFQLEGIIDFKPHIAAILNVAPDHLDRHHSVECYQQVKERIFANQLSTDYLVLNYDDEKVRALANCSQAATMFFSRRQCLAEGVFVKDDQFVIAWNGQVQTVCSVNDLAIKGSHNIENVLAACAAAFLAGVQTVHLAAAIQAFAGVEHRIEFVSKINDVEYYNDSKATNPESAIKALEAFDGNIVLIAGGRDKLTAVDDFFNLASHKVTALIVLGEAAERFAAAARQAGVRSIHHADCLEAAVTLAASLARPGQVVLLSPACASYDMFDNYGQRGLVFKNSVGKLS